LALAALDLMQHGLARDAEPARGFLEGDEPVRDVGHEAGADVIGEPDPPGCVGGRLLAGQQTVSEPATDGCGRDAKLAGGAVDGDELAVGVGWRGGGDVGALARGADAGLGERQPGSGAPACLLRIVAI